MLPPHTPTAILWRPCDLPGLRALREAPAAQPEVGLDWALVVLGLFAAPPALLLAGWVAPGGAAGGPALVLWTGACISFFAGLAGSLRLEPLPPRRVFEARASWRSERPVEVTMQDWVPSGIELPGVEAEMSRAEALEQLAKLRERGDLSNREHADAVATLESALAGRAA